jgi:steroid delta-isomerase-like uncharacterized protein
MKKLLIILPLALFLCFMVGCQDKEALTELEEFKAQAAVEEQNKEMARKFVEALDEGNFDIHEELFADDYVCHFAGIPEPLSRDAQKQLIKAYYEAFPNNTHSIEDIIAKDDKVIFRQINRATQEGEYYGITSTGKQVEYAGIWIFRVANDKIIESWGIEDNLGTMMQLGMELRPKEDEK